MKVFFTLTITLCFISTAFAQIKFEKGYFIDHTDKKVECLIRNEDWGRAPSEFKYKLSENDPIETATTSNIKEFYIEKYGTFRSAEVDVDQSPTALNQLSNEKNPIWKRKKLFLELLVDGDAVLYFNRSAFAGFFYSVNEGEIKQLVWKQYTVEGGSLAINNGFRQQLVIDLVCAGANLSPERLAYSRQELIRYFTQYNQCANPSFEADKKEKPSREIFRASVLAGVNLTSLAFNYNGTQALPNADFGNKTNFHVGLDFELILPFKKNKWGIISDIRYQEYKSTHEDNSSSSHISVQFARVDLGFRHHIFLKSGNKIHLDGTLNIWNYLVDGNYQYHQTYWTTDELKDFPLEMAKSSGFVSPSSIGMGFTTRKIGLELRYTNYKFVVYNAQYPADDMKGISLSAKYTLIRAKNR